MTYRMLPTLGLAALLLGAAPVALHAEVQPMALVQPITEYKIYVSQALSRLVKETKAFTDAVKAGDVAKAKALFALRSMNCMVRTKRRQPRMLPRAHPHPRRAAYHARP